MILDFVRSSERLFLNTTFAVGEIATSHVYVLFSGEENEDIIFAACKTSIEIDNLFHTVDGSEIPRPTTVWMYKLPLYQLVSWISEPPTRYLYTNLPTSQHHVFPTPRFLRTPTPTPPCRGALGRCGKKFATNFGCTSGEVQGPRRFL